MFIGKFFKDEIALSLVNDRVEGFYDSSKSWKSLRNKREVSEIDFFSGGVQPLFDLFDKIFWFWSQDSLFRIGSFGF